MTHQVIRGTPLYEQVSVKSVGFRGHETYLRGRLGFGPGGCLQPAGRPRHACRRPRHRPYPCQGARVACHRGWHASPALWRTCYGRVKDEITLPALTPRPWAACCGPEAAPSCPSRRQRPSTELCILSPESPCQSAVRGIQQTLTEPPLPVSLNRQNYAGALREGKRKEVPVCLRHVDAPLLSSTAGGRVHR